MLGESAALDAGLVAALGFDDDLSDFYDSGESGCLGLAESGGRRALVGFDGEVL